MQKELFTKLVFSITVPFFTNAVQEVLEYPFLQFQFCEINT